MAPALITCNKMVSIFGEEDFVCTRLDISVSLVGSEGSINPVIPRTQMCHGRECVLFHFLECEISPRGIIKGSATSSPRLTTTLDLNNRKKVDILVANSSTTFYLGG